jgi:excisionase family DNA binding protein
MTTERGYLRPDGLPRTLTVEEAATWLRISRSSAFRAVKRGDLPSLRVGRAIRIPTHRLLAILDDLAGGARG